MSLRYVKYASPLNIFVRISANPSLPQQPSRVSLDICDVPRETASMTSPEPKKTHKQYAQGYTAGRKYVEREVMDLRRQVRDLERTAVEKREERVYFRCLEIALQNCQGWSLGKKEIRDVEGYSTLAKIFAENAISRLE